MINAILTLGTVLRANAKSERGATAVEYGLLVALIAAIIVGAVAILGGNVLEGFTTVNNELGGEAAADADAG